jgi:uncharacterized membrane protein YphA (DoxX/SURF4 family)
MIKPEIILLIRMLILVFMSILFIQSGMDKILNYKSSEQWVRSFFEKTIFRAQSKIMHLLLTLLEICAGFFCLIGVFMGQNMANPIGFYGLFLSNVAFLCLFLGQRVAKDYVGAANIPGYFIVALLGLLTYLF